MNALLSWGGDGDGVVCLFACLFSMLLVFYILLSENRKLHWVDHIYCPALFCSDPKE